MIQKDRGTLLKQYYFNIYINIDKYFLYRTQSRPNSFDVIQTFDTELLNCIEKVRARSSREGNHLPTHEYSLRVFQVPETRFGLVFYMNRVTYDNVAVDMFSSYFIYYFTLWRHISGFLLSRVGSNVI